MENKDILEQLAEDPEYLAMSKSEVGMEEFVESQPVMDVHQQRPPLPSGIFVRSRDGVHFNVYFRSDIVFRPRDINLLCWFLDTRTEQHVVTFNLGVDIVANNSSVIGPVIGAINDCKATTVGRAGGLCSLPETMIWLFCKERVVRRYGALMLTKADIVDTVEQYSNYYDVTFSKAVELGIVTKQDISDIRNKNRKIMLTYDKFQ